MQEIAWEDLYRIKTQEIQNLRQEIEKLQTAYTQIHSPLLSKKNSLNTDPLQSKILFRKAQRYFYPICQHFHISGTLYRPYQFPINFS